MQSPHPVQAQLLTFPVYSHRYSRKKAPYTVAFQLAV
jgi:hypothetical protein